MSNKSVYVAFCNQKGGVGKSAFTTLVASSFHYAGNKNVAVIDCDYPQFSIYTMRERDKSFVLANDHLKELLTAQYESIGKKAYTILSTKTEDALSVANEYVSNSDTKIDVVFFDLAGTVSGKGIMTLMLNMDYIFCPVTTDRLVMQSSLTYASVIKDCMSKYPAISLKGFHLFWNQLVKTENREVYDAYSKIIEQLNLNVLKTEIPFTIKYKREMSQSNKQIFRSTLFPPSKSLLKGTNLEAFVEEIRQIINLQQNGNT